MATESGDLLLAPEAEGYVQALETHDIADIGSPKWNQHHEYLEKLNMQAVLNASQNMDEFVKEFLITHDKIPVLIHELIATETWKQNVFPEFSKLGLEPKLLFPIYMVLYHEATIANLLETVMFHEEATSSASDNALDLIDYCYRKICHLVARTSQENDEDESDLSPAAALSNTSSLEELEKQNKTLNFDIAIKAVSILRYVVDHLSSLSLSTTTRILNTHDIPVLLVELIENPPWTRERKGKLMKYVDNQWKELTDDDRFKLSKIEGQVWLSIYQLLMSEDCQKKYELSPYRKNVILKLRSHVTEVVLDQIPVLGNLRHYLEQLSMMEIPPYKKELILEQVPEIRDNLMKEYDGKWGKLAKKQLKQHFNKSKTELRSQAQKWSEMYSLDMLESLIPEPPKCALCGQPASKRCSRCQNEWYCRRECQVGHWKKHKKACNLLEDNMAKIKIAEEKEAS